MKGNRGRPGIKPFVRQYIYIKAQEDNIKPRLALAMELRKSIEEMGEIPPSEETMIKLISEGRHRQPNPEDLPWSLESLDKFPIPPEALPLILQAWVYFREYYQIPLSIRHAKWIARLCFVVKDMKALSAAAITQANVEIMTSILDEKPNAVFGVLELFTLLTGEEIQGKRRKNILAAEKNSMFNRKMWEDFAEHFKLKSVIRKMRGEMEKHERTHHQEV